MAEQEQDRRGRPRRTPVEAVRTIWWYYAVRFGSGTSEAALERLFEDPDRRTRATGRTTRWNKYKFGRSTPPQELISAVGQLWPGTKATFEHPMWDLAERSAVGHDELLAMSKHLPEFVVHRLVSDAVPEGSLFWMRRDVSLVSVVGEILNADRAKSSFGPVCFALLFVAQLSKLVQDEEAHFSAYQGIASIRDWPFAEHLKGPAAMTVAVLLRDWTRTVYRSEALRMKVDQLRKVRSGPRPPWLDEQMSLHLGSQGERIRELETDLTRHFWIAAKLATCVVESTKKVEGETRE